MPGEHQGLGEAFVRAAERYASEPALDDGAEVLTYEVLLDRAARLAGGLDRIAGRRVGLAAHRDQATYLLYLAVLLSGRAVVPVDPALGDRVARICREAEVDLVVTSSGRNRIGPTSVVPVSELSGPAHVAPGGEMAYILHTSGSTGAPKGVPISHDNVLSYLSQVIPRHQVGPGARCSATFQLTFDPSVHDMFVTWLGGGTLVLPRGRESALPVTYVRDRRLTHWFSVPSVIRTADRLRSLAPNSMPELTSALFCGEQFLLSDAASWQRAAPNAAIENLYGPTELTVTCSAYRLPADPTQWPRTSNGTVPIGQPYPDVEYRLGSGESVPEGELLVRGPQRFAGYLNTTDQDCFISLDDGPPWYRTGDVVRREGGVLVHLRRVDEQLQRQGYRVEPAEVEAVLRGQPGVHDAAAFPITAPEGTLLGAVVVAPDASTVRKELLTEVPAYLVPDFIMSADEFPLGSNGKTDRGTLREWINASWEQCRLWSEALRTVVQPTDNFFDLGGDSLVALTVSARARAAGWEVAAADILELQTPEAIGGRARRLEPAPIPAPMPSSGGPVPLLPAQARFLSRGFRYPEQDTVAAWLDVPTTLDVADWRRLTAVLAEHHEAFAIVFRDGEQVLDPQTRPSYRRIGPAEVADRSAEELARFASAMRAEPVLDGRPLLNLHHLDLGAGAGRLLVVAHHLIMDAVSWSVLQSDLRRWHDDLRDGREPELGRRPGTSLSQWAQLLADYAAGDRTTEVCRWLALPWSEVAQLPLDRLTEPFFIEKRHVLPNPIGEFLRGLGHREARSLIAAALALAVSAWSRGGALLDVVVHGRDGMGLGVDLSSTIGWLATDSPVVLRPADCSSLWTARDAVRQQLDGPGDVEFSTLRFLGRPGSIAAQLTGLPQPGVLLNVRDHRPAGNPSFAETGDPVGATAAEHNPYAIRLAVDLSDSGAVLRWRYHHPSAAAVHESLLGRVRSALAKVTAGKEHSR